MPAKQPPAAPVAEPPALPATLDIKIDMPGNIFVRGHGLDSEWRGKLAITGTSAAPAINGSLEQIRGSVDLLGKTFTLTRGRIIFDGSDKLDPVLDIVAEASTADITAQVNIGGLASAPTITLTSTPVVPQDEILSRVLFGKGVGQITAGEGLQLAAAAATLAGGGPGVLDRLRGGLGLDWFRLGSGTSGPTTGTSEPRRCEQLDEQLGNGRHRAQRREIHRPWGLRRRQPGHLATNQQGHGGGRGAAASDRRRGGRPGRQHRPRDQLQLRLLIGHSSVIGPCRTRVAELEIVRRQDQQGGRNGRDRQGIGSAAAALAMEPARICHDLAGYRLRAVGPTGVGGGHPHRYNRA